jgi:hypothetical protein
VFDSPLDHAALLALELAWGVRYDRGRRLALRDIGDPAADCGVEGVAVQLSQHLPERPLAGHHEPACERIPPCPQAGQLLRQGLISSA